jgi:hypothetical protein
MDQPIRSRRKVLPPDHPTPIPGTPPYPAHPDLDIDVEVVDIKLPGDGAPAPDRDPMRERVNATVKPAATVPDTGSHKKQP